MFSLPISCFSFPMALFFPLLSLTFRGQGSICYKLPCAQSDSRNRHLMEANFRSVLPMHTTGQKGCEERSVVFLPSPSVQHSTSGPSIHPPTHSKGVEQPSAPPPAACVPLLGFDYAQMPITDKALTDMHNVYLLWHNAKQIVLCILKQLWDCG